MDDQDLREEMVLAALVGISEMMGKLSDVDELLDGIVRIAPRLASVDRCAIALWDPTRREFRVAYAFSSDRAASARLKGLAIPEADVPRLSQKVVHQKLPVMFRASSEPFLPPRIVRALNIRSMLVVPLAHQDEALGFVALDEPGEDHVFTSREVNVVTSIASHAAVALAHARLRTAFEHERRRSHAIASATADGVLTLDRQLHIVALDPGAEDLLGWTADEVAGRPCAQVFRAGDNGSLGDPGTVAREVLGGAPRGTGVLRLQRKDGGSVTCRVTATPVPSSGRARAEVVCVMRRVESEAPAAATPRAGTRG